MTKQAILNSPIQKRAAIYARVSSSKQKDEGTIESQVNAILDYAKTHNLEVPKEWIFKDEGYSGSNIQRPSLDALRDLVATGSPDTILMYQPDRLARKYAYQILLLEEFGKFGIEVLFCKNQPSDSPEGLLLEQFQGIFAEYERALITERCRRGKQYKARQGSITVLPVAPYGYRFMRNKETGLTCYEINQEEEKVVQSIFEMYVYHNKPLAAICRKLDQEGIKPRRSLLGWEKETIRKMLKNRAYMGLAGYCKTEAATGDSQRIVRGPKNGRIQVSKHARKMKPEEEWITIPVPAIISETLYRKAQDKLSEASHFASRNTRKPSILQGVLVCGKCQASYYKKIRKNAYTYYDCGKKLKGREKKEDLCNNRSIRQDSLDEYIWDWVITMLQSPEILREEIKRRVAENREKNEVVQRQKELIREQTKLENSRNKLLDAYSDGECLSLEELKKRMHLLNQRKQQIEKELVLLEHKSISDDQIKQMNFTIEKFGNIIKNSTVKLSIEEKQRVVRSLIDEVIIEEDSITIRHCIPLDKDAKNCLLKPLHYWLAVA